MEGRKTSFIEYLKTENQQPAKQPVEQRQMEGPKASFARCRRMFLAGALLTTPAAWAIPQEFPDQEVREVGSGASAEGIYIVTANTENSIDGCGSRFLLEAGHPLLDQNLALVLSALYAHNRIHVQVDGCGGAGAMRLKSIRVVR